MTVLLETMGPPSTRRPGTFLALFAELRKSPRVFSTPTPSPPSRSGMPPRPEPHADEIVEGLEKFAKYEIPANVHH